MKKFNLNINLLPPGALLRVLRFPPQRYWEKLLMVFLALALVVLSFDIWVFWNASRVAPLAGEELRASGSQRGSLEAVYRESERRNKNFEKYRRGVVLPDPAR